MTARRYWLTLVVYLVALAAIGVYGPYGWWQGLALGALTALTWYGLDALMFHTWSRAETRHASSMQVAQAAFGLIMLAAALAAVAGWVVVLAGGHAVAAIIALVVVMFSPALHIRLQRAWRHRQRTSFWRTLVA